MYTASIFFFGQYRPAYFEAETKVKAFQAAAYAVAGCQDQRWFIERLDEACSRLSRSCTSVSIENGARGISIVARPHDPWLDSTTRDYPPYPGLDYAGAANV